MEVQKHGIYEVYIKNRMTKDATTHLQTEISDLEVEVPTYSTCQEILLNFEANKRFHLELKFARKKGEHSKGISKNGTHWNYQDVIAIDGENSNLEDKGRTIRLWNWDNIESQIKPGQFIKLKGWKYNVYIPNFGHPSVKTIQQTVASNTIFTRDDTDEP